MTSFNYIRDNIQHVSIYALLDWLEMHFKQKISENHRLTFKSNITMSVPASEVHSVEYSKDEIVLILNNLGLTSLQGGMEAYVVEEIINRIQNGDHVLSDFIDIFNHRIVEIMYTMRQSMYFHYTNNKAKVIRNFDYQSNSVAKFIKTIKDLYKDKITITLQKGLPRRIKIRSLYKLGNPLQKSILGTTCVVNDSCLISLSCLDWHTYSDLIYFRDVMNTVMKNIEIHPMTKLYMQVPLGTAKLGSFKL